jgi:hypothetical protein
MILPIIALLLLGLPATPPNTIGNNKTAAIVPQKEKTIPLDLNNDKGLKAKFPDAPDLEQDIIGMLELAIEKAWLRQIN